MSGMVEPTVCHIRHDTVILCYHVRHSVESLNMYKIFNSKLEHGVKVTNMYRNFNGKINFTL